MKSQIKQEFLEMSSNKDINLIKIKIGIQKQANKPIFLLNNGNIICGNFHYRGRYIKKFREYYSFILNYANSSPKDGVLDVSKVHFWDAISIYNDYMVPKWQKTITVEKISKMANETEIRMKITDIEDEFIRAVSLKWRKIFRNSEPGDPQTPKQAWQIL